MWPASCTTDLGVCLEFYDGFTEDIKVQSPYIIASTKLKVLVGALIKAKLILAWRCISNRNGWQLLNPL